MAYLIYNKITNEVLMSKQQLHNVEATIGIHGEDYDYIEAPDDFQSVKYEFVIDGVAIPKVIDPYERLRETRDMLLKNSDWTQVRDVPVDQTAWELYRQQLRDLPANTADPANPEWPTPPQ